MGRTGWRLRRSQSERVPMSPPPPASLLVDACAEEEDEEGLGNGSTAKRGRVVLIRRRAIDEEEDVGNEPPKKDDCGGESRREAAKTSDNAEEERRENVKEDLGENGQVAVARKEEKGNDSSGKKSKKTNGNVENVSKGKKVVPKVRRSVSSVESRAVVSEATVVEEESEEKLNSDIMNSGQPRRSGGRRGASASSASRLRQHFASLIGGGGGSASIGPVDFASSSSTGGKRTASLGRQRTVTLLGSSDDCNLSVLDDERSESTPVLLSVKPRRSAASASDSGHETGAESNHSGSPMLDAAQRRTKECSPLSRWDHPDDVADGNISSANITKTKGGGGKGGFFRLFHRSATLLFNHPTTELNPDKPYKGTITLKDDHNGAKPKKLPASRMAYYHHSDYTRSRLLDLPVSSTSSLNSSVMLHHLENDEGDGQRSSSASTSSGRKEDATTTAATTVASSSSTGVLDEVPISRIVVVHRAARRQRHQHRHRHLQQQQQQQGMIHSSSNSVSSSVDSSTCDSGAYSRTSTPDHLAAAARATGPISLTNARSTLALSLAPLHAPSLVMEACGMKRRSRSSDVFGSHRRRNTLLSEEDLIDADKILAYLSSTAAAEEERGARSMTVGYPSTVPSMLRTAVPPTVGGAVSITIGGNGGAANPGGGGKGKGGRGGNTSITLAPNSLPSSSASGSSLRRARSGLPVLGTAAKLASSSSNRPSPAKPTRNQNAQFSSSAAARSRISTVFLNSSRTVTRSESCSAGGRRLWCCEESGVTVNGQHHCSNSSLYHMQQQQQQQMYSSLTLPVASSSSSMAAEAGGRRKKRRAPPAPVSTQEAEGVIAAHSDNVAEEGREGEESQEALALP